MFLECNATAPDGSNKKTGGSEQPAMFKHPTDFAARYVCQV